MHSRGRKASFGVRRPSSTPSPGCCRGWELRHWLEGAPACYKGPPAMRAALQGAALAFPVRCCALVGRFADPRIAESVSTLLPHLDRKSTRLNSSHVEISYAVFCLKKKKKKKKKAQKKHTQKKYVR